MKNPIEGHSKRLKQFLLSQYFSDGLRITLGILLPSVICFQFNKADIGITLSLGALSVSIVDNPGPFSHRRNAMLITLGLIFLMAILTGILSNYTWLLAVFIAVCCFVFSMLNVFGARAASIGIAALILMVLGIDQHLTLHQTWLYALFVLTGGLWYLLLSSFTQQLMPYRPAEQTLGECVMQMAEFMRIKAGFYNTDVDIDEQYKKLIDKQAEVHQYQESTREILFRTRKLMRDSSPTGRRLLLTFVDLVDLHEQTMATQYNYADIREQFGTYAILSHLEQIISQLADELEHIGMGLHNNERSKPLRTFLPKLTLLKKKIDEIEATGVNVLVLKRILINLRNISARIQRIYEYEDKSIPLPENRSKELPRFVPHQTVDWKVFRNNLSLKSNHFRHAVRVSVICLLAFVFTRLVSEGQHSYWILLTILVILKPGYSLTRKRNNERIIGTIAGGVLGLLVLWLFPSTEARFAFLLVFMLLSYSFLRIQYIVSVLFMTPYVLIVFSFTGNTNEFLVTWERISDTLIGAVAALSASYFILPSWESYQLKTVIGNMLKANAEYLKCIIERSDDTESQSLYRLARKELYVQSANLATALQRMLSEPKSKQKNADYLYRFAVLNHQLSSYFATLSYQLKPNEELYEEQLKLLRSTLYVLQDAYTGITSEKLSTDIKTRIRTIPDNAITTEMLQLMYQTASDIKKLTAQMQFDEQQPK